MGLLIFFMIVSFMMSLVFICLMFLPVVLILGRVIKIYKFRRKAVSETTGEVVSYLYVTEDNLTPVVKYVVDGKTYSCSKDVGLRFNHVGRKTIVVRDEDGRLIDM